MGKKRIPGYLGGCSIQPESIRSYFKKLYKKIIGWIK